MKVIMNLKTGELQIAEYCPHMKHRFRLLCVYGDFPWGTVYTKERYLKTEEWELLSDYE